MLTTAILPIILATGVQSAPVFEVAHAETTIDDSGGQVLAYDASGATVGQIHIWQVDDVWFVVSEYADGFTQYTFAPSGITIDGTLPPGDDAERIGETIAALGHSQPAQRGWGGCLMAVGTTGAALATGNPIAIFGAVAVACTCGELIAPKAQDAICTPWW